MINKDDFISIEENIQKKIIKERQEDYGDYEENFALLAEMFSIILFDKIRVALTQRNRPPPNRYTTGSSSFWPNPLSLDALISF